MTVRRSLAIALSASVAIAGLVTATTTTAASGAAPAAKLQPRAAVTNTSVMAVIKTIPLLNVSNDRITGIAVNAADDTIYVATGSPGTSKYLMVVNGDTAATRTLNFPDRLTDVAVNQVDDTVYVSVSGATTSLFAVRGATDDSTSVAVGTDPRQIAVNSLDDTVYVTNNSGLRIYPGSVSTNRELRLNGSDLQGLAVNDLDDTIYVAGRSSNNVSFVNGLTDDSQQFAAGTNPSRVAVNQGDDTVYVTRNSPVSLLVMNGVTGAPSTSVSMPYMDEDSDVAVHQGDDTVYVTVPSASTSLYVLRGTNVDDSTASTIGSVTGPLAVDDTGDGNGLVYVAASGQLKVVGLVSPVLSGSGPGAAGATVTVSVTSSPTVGYSFDSGMVSHLRFNGASSVAASPGPGQGQWSATLPSGLPAGPVTVEAVFAGGTALAGTYTVESSGPPTPTPVYPPGAPTDVKATAGSGEASVSWTAPTDVGSYPITDYEVTSSTGSHTCVTKSTSCTITGLTGGTSYTFTVRALNGAGWGAYSSPSNAVTPTAPTIVITGSRDASDDRYVKVRGTTTDLAGRQVVPYVRFPGETVATAGTGVRTVSADGSFTWQRKTGKKVYVYFQHAEVRSNTVTITAR